VHGEKSTIGIENSIPARRNSIALLEHSKLKQLFFYRSASDGRATIKIGTDGNAFNSAGRQDSRHIIGVNFKMAVWHWTTLETTALR
jgi:hypothetical protein